MGIRKSGCRIAALIWLGYPALSYSEKIHIVTAYSHGCTQNKNNPKEIRQRAANGEWPVDNKTIAADWRLYPPNSEVIIEGIGVWKVTDKGSAIKGLRIDLFVSNCKFAKEWGRRKLRVWKVPITNTVWGNYKNDYR